MKDYRKDMEDWREREAREEKAVMRVAGGAAIIAGAFVLGLGGVIIWAIVKIVSAVTS